MLLYFRNINQKNLSIVLLLISLLTLQMTIDIDAVYSQNSSNQPVEWHMSQIEKLEKVLVQEKYLLEGINEQIIHYNKVIQELIFANECLSGNKMIGFPFDFKYNDITVQNIRELQVFASLLKTKQIKLEQFHISRKNQMLVINDIQSKIEYHSKQLDKLKAITGPKDLEGMWLIVGNGSIISIYKDQNFGTMTGVLAKIVDIKCHRVRDIIWTNIKIADQKVFVGTENSYDLQCRPLSYPFSLIPSGSFLQYSSKFSTMTLKKIYN